MDIAELIVQFSIPLITVVCFCICYGIKKTGIVKDNYIPLISMFLGGISGLLMNGLSYEAVASGIASGGLAVAAHQAYKQLSKDDGYSI